MTKAGNNKSKNKAGTKKVRKKKGGKRVIHIPNWSVITIATVLLLLLIVLPLLNQRGGKYDGEPLPEISFSALGIDISHNNKGPIVWDSLYVLTDRQGHMHKSMKDARNVYPIKFVFIKASEGVGMKDPMFKQNWEAAGERNIQRGAYHFFRSSKDGELQARNFINTVGELRHIDMPPVLDIETMHLGCTRKQLNHRALQWLECVSKAYGRKAIVYSSESFIRDMLDKEITDNYPIWIAHYGVSSPDTDNWDFWQFTDRACVYGLPEPVDLNLRR